MLRIIIPNTRLETAHLGFSYSNKKIFLLFATTRDALVPQRVLLASRVMSVVWAENMGKIHFIIITSRKECSMWRMWILPFLVTFGRMLTQLRLERIKKEGSKAAASSEKLQHFYCFVLTRGRRSFWWARIFEFLAPLNAARRCCSAHNRALVNGERKTVLNAVPNPYYVRVV